MEGRTHEEEDRPVLAVSNSGTEAAVNEFVSGFQAGHDHRDADLPNRQFASDVAWGSPYGALVEGYEQLHPVHVRFQSREGGPRARYEVRHTPAIADDVIVAHIARLILGPDDQRCRPVTTVISPLLNWPCTRSSSPGVLVVGAGQNTPMKPGGALPAKV
jgi:hypothetical protein